MKVGQLDSRGRRWTQKRQNALDRAHDVKHKRSGPSKRRAPRPKLPLLSTNLDTTIRLLVRDELVALLRRIT
jgi:hypothetical protein